MGSKKPLDFVPYTTQRSIDFWNLPPKPESSKVRTVQIPWKGLMLQNVKNLIYKRCVIYGQSIISFKIKCVLTKEKKW